MLAESNTEENICEYINGGWSYYYGDREEDIGLDTPIGIHVNFERKCDEEEEGDGRERGHSLVFNDHCQVFN